jgi:hypothetical protein
VFESKTPTLKKRNGEVKRVKLEKRKKRDILNEVYRKSDTNKKIELKLREEHLYEKRSS